MTFSCPGTVCFDERLGFLIKTTKKLSVFPGWDDFKIGDILI